jgi:hypothetical protein
VSSQSVTLDFFNNKCRQSHNFVTIKKLHIFRKSKRSKKILITKVSSVTDQDTPMNVESNKIDSESYVETEIVSEEIKQGEEGQEFLYIADSNPTTATLIPEDSTTSQDIVETDQTTIPMILEDTAASQNIVDTDQTTMNFVKYY